MGNHQTQHTHTSVVQAASHIGSRPMAIQPIQTHCALIMHVGRICTAIASTPFALLSQLTALCSIAFCYSNQVGYVLNPSTTITVHSVLNPFITAAKPTPSPSVLLYWWMREGRILEGRKEISISQHSNTYRWKDGWKQILLKRDKNVWNALSNNLSPEL